MPEPSLHLSTFYSRTADGPVRPMAAWERELGKNRAADLLAQKILLPASISGLDGETIRHNFGEGEKDYRVEFSGGSAKAWPEDEIGKAYAVDVGLHPLRLDDRAALDLVARTNGGDLAPVAESNPWFAIVRRALGQKRIVLVFVLDWSRLARAEAWLAVEQAVGDVAAHVRIVVDRSPKTSAHFLHMQSPEIISSESCSGFFRVPRHSYCHPRLGVNAQDAVAVYPEIPVIVDMKGDAIFLHGRKLVFQGKTKSFLFLRGICALGEQEISAANFCSGYLGFHTDEVEAPKHVREARHQVKEKLEGLFSDAPELLKDVKARFIDHGRGQLKRTFPSTDVLVWDDAHKLP